MTCTNYTTRLLHQVDKGFPSETRTSHRPGPNYPGLPGPGGTLSQNRGVEGLPPRITSRSIVLSTIVSGERTTETLDLRQRKSRVQLDLDLDDWDRASSTPTV